MIKEDKFYDILLGKKSEITVALEDIEIIPNYKLKDSPDFVLRVILKLSLLSQDFKIEIPLSIELEKGWNSSGIRRFTKICNKREV